MVEREVPRYQPGSLNHVDPYFVQEHVVLLLVLTHSVIGRTTSSYWKGYYMKEDHRSYLTQLLQLRKEILKKFRLVRDSNPWPLRYRCSVLPIQLERCTGIAEVKGSNLVQAWILSGFFRNCKSCVYKCDDLLSYNSSPRSSHIYDFHIFITWNGYCRVRVTTKSIWTTRFPLRKITKQRKFWIRWSSHLYSLKLILYSKVFVPETGRKPARFA